MDKANYKIKPPVSNTDVPLFRDSKWVTLVDLVLELSSGKSLPVEFQSYKDARQARNAIRDRVNDILTQKGINDQVRTRMIKHSEDKWELFFVRIPAKE